MSASESRSGIVLQLAEEFLDRYRRGERPSLKEYIDRHPELAAEIKEVFPAVAMMENVALADESLAGDETPPGAQPEEEPLRQLGDYRILREVGRGGMGVVYEAEQLSLGRHVALKVLPRRTFANAQQRRRFAREARAAGRLHHTNIVPVFGVGEHDGLPYYVMQFIQGLGLDQVLDELKRLQGCGAPPAGGEHGPRDVTAADVARSLLTGAFQRTMDFVESPAPGTPPPGGSPPGADGPRAGEGAGSAGKQSDSFTLSAVKLPGSGGSRPRTRKPTYWQSVAQIGVQVAEALEYAHRQGVQHRDVKPSNLLLDLQGRVWVTDFGLARAEDEDHLTQTGDFVGTLRYMPPEAFEGRGDRRGDVYSLGLTLYEMAALRPAFEARDRHQLIKRVTTEEPARVDRVNRAVPRDLATVIHKAIDREPARRYQTARELAADLQSFLDDEPIQARRVSRAERLARWCRHHPGIAGLTAVLLVVFGLGFAGVAWQWWRAEGKAEDERFARGRAERAEKVATRTAAAEAVARGKAEATLYFSRIALAERKWLANDVARAEALLDLCRPEEGRPDLRGWEWHYLKRLCHADLLPPMRHGHWVQDVAFSPDGKRIVSAAGFPLGMGGFHQPVGNPRNVPGELAVWDATTGRQLARLEGHTGSVWSVAYSPDGRRIASGSADGTVRLWDADNFKGDVILRGLWGEACWVRFVPDGKTLLVGTGDDVRLWDLATRRETRTIPGAGQLGWNIHRDGLAVSPDGTRLAARKASPGTGQGEMVLYDLKSGRVLHGLADGQAIRPVAFSPDGKRLAGGGHDGRLRVWDAAEGRLLLNVRTGRASIFSVAFSPDGKRLASGGADQAVRLWDVESGDEDLTLRGHLAGVSCLAFSPDGGRLVSGSRDETLKVWDVTRDPRGHGFDVTPRGGGEEVANWAFSSDGWRLLSVHSVAQTLRGWDMANGALRGERGLALRRSVFWPRPDFAFSPSGRLLAGPAEAAPSVVNVWEASAATPVAALRGHEGAVTAVAISPDERRVATACGSAAGAVILRVWDAATGKELRRVPLPPQRVEALAFSHDGKYLAGGSGPLASPDGAAPRVTPQVKVWDAATGKELHSLAGHQDRIVSVAFSPDGRRLASAGYGDRTVRVWDTTTGRPFYAPLPTSGNGTSVTFSPDGTRLAATGTDSLVQLWDAATGQDVLTLHGFSPQGTGTYGFTPRVRFSPDGARIVANDWEGVINVWSTLSAEGLRAAQKKAFDLRLADLDRKLKDRPEDAGLWLQRGGLFANNGRQEEAEADLTRAIELRPPEPHPWLERGRLRLSWGRLDEAAEDLVRAGQLQASDSALWNALGRSYADRGQWGKAAQAFGQFLRLHRSADVHVWFHHGYALQRGGDRDGYRKCCRDMLRRFGDLDGAHELNWTVRTCVLDDGAVPEPGRLVQAARKALAGVPGHSGILFALAAAHYRAGQFREAIQRAQEALDTKVRMDNDDRAQDWLVLALAHQRLGETRAARKWLQQAVRWFEENPWRETGERGAWERRLIAERLRQEAEALIEGKNTGSKK